MKSLRIKELMREKTKKEISILCSKLESIKNKLGLNWKDLEHYERLGDQYNLLEKRLGLINKNKNLKLFFHYLIIEKIVLGRVIFASYTWIFINEFMFGENKKKYQYLVGLIVVILTSYFTSVILSK